MDDAGRAAKALLPGSQQRRARPTEGPAERSRPGAPRDAPAPRRGPLAGRPAQVIALLFPASPARVSRSRRQTALSAGLQLLAVLAGATVLLARASVGNPAWNTLWAEDASIFVPRALLHPLAALTTEASGYIQLVQQLLADLATRLPLRDVAAGLAVGGALLTSACALFVYHASSGHIRLRWLRALLGAAVIMLPIALIEIAANGVNTSWYLLFTACWALIWRPGSRSGAVAAAAVCFAAMSSQFVVVLLAPLVLARLIALPWREQAASLGWLAGLAVQLPALLHGPPAALRGAPGAALGFYADHVLTGAVAGWQPARGLAELLGGGGAALLTGGIVAAVVIWALVRGDGRVRAFVVTAVLLSLLLTVVPAMSRYWVTMLPSPRPTWLPGSRYTVAPILLLLSAAVVVVDAILRRAGGRATARRVTAVTLLLAVLATGWAAGFRYQTLRSTSQPWSRTVASFQRSCAARPPDARVYLPSMYATLPCRVAQR